MRESLDEPISVVAYYHAEQHAFQPYQLTWQNQDWRLGRPDFHHVTRAGRSVIHHFSISDMGEHMYFKLAFHTDTLQWFLEEYMPAGERYVHYRDAAPA